MFWALKPIEPFVIVPADHTKLPPPAITNPTALPTERHPRHHLTSNLCTQPTCIDVGEGPRDAPILFNVVRLPLQKEGHEGDCEWPTRYGIRLPRTLLDLLLPQCFVEWRTIGKRAWMLLSHPPENLRKEVFGRAIERIVVGDFLLHRVDAPKGEMLVEEHWEEDQLSRKWPSSRGCRLRTTLGVSSRFVSSSSSHTHFCVQGHIFTFGNILPKSGREEEDIFEVLRCIVMACNMQMSLQYLSDGVDRVVVNVAIAGS
jgi:hypothetical protein